MDIRSQIGAATAIGIGDPPAAEVQVPEKHNVIRHEKHELDEKNRKNTSPAPEDTESTKSTLPTWKLVGLIAAIWLTTFMAGFQVQVMTPLLPYVYSDFRAHSLIPTASIISSVVGAVSRLPLAKILDIWGRHVGFALALASFTIGTVMMAACGDVVTYCIASVFFWVGFDCMSYALYVIIADHFPLASRGIIFGLYNSPWLITTWIGAPVATAFLQGAGWKWSFGTFSIVCPISGLPLLGLLYWNSSRQAKMQQTTLSRGKEQRSMRGSLKYYWIEFDCIGIILIAAGFSLFLLPFSLYTRQAQGWASPMIISLLVFGGVLIILFALWEKYLAPKCFIPFPLLKSRTVIGACVSYAQTYLVYYCWTSYFSSSLQVVQGLSVTRAGYVFNIHNVGWVVSGIAAGFLIKATGRYKWLAVFLGLPLQILSTGLMIYLSKVDSQTSSIIVVQIFLALGDGLIDMSAIIAVMATIDHHDHLASVLALYYMIGTTFQAIGATISASIWTSTFPEYLAKNLPASAQSNLMSIYSDISTQLSYNEGSPERTAITLSYSQAMQKLFIAGTSIISVGVVSTLVWRDLKISSEKRPVTFSL